MRHRAVKGWFFDMVRYYLTRNEKLETLAAPENGCWVSMISPSEKELMEISGRYELDPDVLRAALDADERSRIDADEGYTMILVNIPTVEAQSDKELYSTIPASILIVKDVVITVCSEDSPIIRAFESGRVRSFRTQMRSRYRKCLCP